MLCPVGLASQWCKKWWPLRTKVVFSRNLSGRRISEPAARALNKFLRSKSHQLSGDSLGFLFLPPPRAMQQKKKKYTSMAGNGWIEGSQWFPSLFQGWWQKLGGAPSLIGKAPPRTPRGLEAYSDCNLSSKHLFSKNPRETTIGRGWAPCNLGLPSTSLPARLAGDSLIASVQSDVLALQSYYCWSEQW